jgi:ZIP family zinc transporter
MEMILNFDTIMLALGLTMIAGLSTGIGGLMSFFSKATNTRFLSAALGLSAGVMVYVSLLEMMPEAYEKMAEVFEGKLGKVYVLLAFFAGMGMIALIDFFIP